MAADFYVKYMIQIQAANDIGFGPKSPVVFGYSGEKSEWRLPKGFSNVASKYELACVCYKYKLLMILVLEPKALLFFVT